MARRIEDDAEAEADPRCPRHKLRQTRGWSEPFLVVSIASAFGSTGNVSAPPPLPFLPLCVANANDAHSNSKEQQQQQLQLLLVSI